MCVLRWLSVRIVKDCSQFILLNATLPTLMLSYLVSFKSTLNTFIWVSIVFITMWCGLTLISTLIVKLQTLQLLNKTFLKLHRDFTRNPLFKPSASLNPPCTTGFHFLFFRNSWYKWDKSSGIFLTLFCFNPVNKYAESSSVTFLERHYKAIHPSVLYDRHCFVHIWHVHKVLSALQSDLFLHQLPPLLKPSDYGNPLSVTSHWQKWK